MHISKVINFQQFTSANLASVVACSTELLKNAQSGESADAAVFTVGGSSGAIRFRDDGTAPTSNIGHRLAVGTVPYLYQGDIQKLLFIRDSTAGNADLNISYVKASE